MRTLSWVKSSFLITWGHEKINGFTKSSFLITWGHIEVTGVIGVMEVVSDQKFRR